MVGRQVAQNCRWRLCTYPYGIAFTCTGHRPNSQNLRLINGEWLVMLQVAMRAPAPARAYCVALAVAAAPVIIKRCVEFVLCAVWIFVVASYHLFVHDLFFLFSVIVNLALRFNHSTIFSYQEQYFWYPDHFESSWSVWVIFRTLICLHSF